MFDRLYVSPRVGNTKDAIESTSGKALLQFQGLLVDGATFQGKAYELILSTFVNSILCLYSTTISQAYTVHYGGFYTIVQYAHICTGTYRRAVFVLKNL